MLAKKAAPLIFFFLLTLALIVPLSARPAYGDAPVSFDYDGEEHLVDAVLYDDVSTAFRWYKNGVDEPVSDTRYLSVKHVSDSGAYRLYSADGEPALVAEISVVIAPMDLTVSWHTLRSATSPIYQTPYTYDKTTHGVFPYPENLVLGDEISFSTAGNTAQNAGKHTARILSVDGQNAADYALSETEKNFDFTIAKATVYACPEDTEILYGASLGTVSVAFEGLCPGDENAVTGAVASDYIVGDEIGTRTLSYVGTADNYVVVSRDATLTILPRPVVVRLYDAEGVYGDEILPRYDLEDATYTPPFSARTDSPHVGTHALYLDCADENFRLEYTPATYRITPRPVTLTVTAANTPYGTAPTYRYSLTKGTLAPGDDFYALRLSFTTPPEAVGSHTVYPTAATPDYRVETAPFAVTITPFPVVFSVRDVVARYGEAYVSPIVTVDRALPYGQTIDDLDLEITKDPGWTCGAYAFNTVCHNPNYKATAGRSATYTILPRELNVSLDVPAEPVIRQGESLTPSIRFDAPIGTDDVTPTVAYYKLNANGITEKEPVYTLTEKGEYVPRVSLLPTEDADNYVAVFLDTGGATGKVLRVYSDTHVEQTVRVTLPGGFVPSVSLIVETPDVRQFADRFEKTTSFQSIIAAYHFDFVGTYSQKMLVSVPINHDNRHYTAAIIKEDGSVVYTPCTVENGFATFEAAALSRTFLIWEDKDGTPYMVLCVFLAFLLLCQLVVLSALYKKHKAKNPGGNLALAPLSLSLSGGGGIYFFVAGSCFLGICNVVAGIAILVFVLKLTRKKHVKIIQ